MNTLDSGRALDFLQNYKSPSGNPTSMISLIIPPDTNIEKLRGRLTHEVATSTNIKDKSNRLSVGVALNKITDYLKSVKNLPDTGIAIYSEQYL